MEGTELLLAEREIRQVVLRYCRGVDRGDAELIRDCYHDGATDVHGHYRGGGREFADYVVPVLAQRYAATTHAVHGSLIEWEGQAAHVETYFVACHLSTEPAGQAHLYVFVGRYADLFDNRGDGWRIAHRVVLRDWSVRQPVPEGALARELTEAEAFVAGRRDRDDLAYPEAFARRLAEQRSSE
ncbi:MAG TPA: nuclear transport factor 2 family protein [Kribbella sp.]|nr:nuclear transport factor 2 family protein [Amycolatopsis sp.]HWD77321.1 nuclear transport factor 2 family protein [Kribbella sp.]